MQADLCRLLPAVPRSMSACMREFFQRIGALDPQLSSQLAEWLAYHLSNFDFMWPWAKWSYVLQAPAHHPQRSPPTAPRCFPDKLSAESNPENRRKEGLHPIVSLADGDVVVKQFRTELQRQRLSGAVLLAAIYARVFVCTSSPLPCAPCAGKQQGTRKMLHLSRRAANVLEAICCRRFVVEVFSRLIRLSYYSNILSKVPEGYKEIFPPEPKPQPLEPAKDSNGDAGSGTPPAELERASQLVQLVRISCCHFILDWASSTPQLLMSMLSNPT